jgi:hypothetical protein
MKKMVKEEALMPSSNTWTTGKKRGSQQGRLRSEGRRGTRITARRKEFVSKTAERLG